MENKVYTRNCPECGYLLKCKSKYYMLNAEKNKSKCKSCGRMGIKFSEETKRKMSKNHADFSDKNHPMYGRCVYDIWLEKYGKEEADKRQKEANEKISKSNKGKKQKSNYYYWEKRYGKEEADKRQKIANEKNSKSNKGKIVSKETRRKMSKSNIMNKKTVYEIWVEKYGKEEAGRRQQKSNRKNSESNKGRKVSKKTIKLKRLSALKNIENRCGQVIPNYNLSSIPILEQVAKKYNINDLMHAENGGEFYIKELGYWTDGFSPDKNIAFEYMERDHEKTIEKDKRRRQEIINHLGCKFVEIWYTGEVKEFI